MSDEWQKANLLPRFYEKNAKSIGGITSQFKIVKFEFGHDPDLIDDGTNPPTLTPYSGDRNDTPGKFYEGTLDADDIVYSEGRLLFKCRMPENTVSEPKQYSLTILRDNDGDVVAASVDLPDWVSPDEGIETHPYINFPMN